MHSTKDRIILALFSLVPYVLCSLAFVAFTDRAPRDFWIALFVLIGLRWFFSLIETLGGVLMWRAYGFRNAVAKNLLVLRANGFPKERETDDDFLSYLQRIRDDSGAHFALRASAREFEAVLRLAEESGILLGMRTHAAADAAFDIHSPKRRTIEDVPHAA